MYVLHAWKSSLQIFIPSNFKLFLLVTLKTIVSTFKKYLKYGWPFILTGAFFAGIVLSFDKSFDNTSELMAAIKESQMPKAWLGLLAIGGLVALLSYIFCNFLVAIFARPSVDQKNCAYMRTFTTRYFLGYLLLNFFFAIVTVLLRVNWPLVLAGVSSLEIAEFPVSAPQHFLEILWYITNLFGILFYLDLGGSFSSVFKSLWFAIKMTFYNLPLVAIIAGVLLLGARIGDDYLQILSYLHLILYPFLFCFMATLYTKKVHDQARLYQGN